MPDVTMTTATGPNALSDSKIKAEPTEGGGPSSSPSSSAPQAASAAANNGGNTATSTAAATERFHHHHPFYGTGAGGPGQYPPPPLAYGGSSGAPGAGPQMYGGSSGGVGGPPPPPPPPHMMMQGGYPHHPSSYLSSSYPPTSGYPDHHGGPPPPGGNFPPPPSAMRGGGVPPPYGSPYAPYGPPPAYGGGDPMFGGAYGPPPGTDGHYYPPHHPQSHPSHANPYHHPSHHASSSASPPDAKVRGDVPSSSTTAQKQRNSAGTKNGGPRQGADADSDGMPSQRAAAAAVLIPPARSPASVSTHAAGNRTGGGGGGGDGGSLPRPLNLAPRSNNSRMMGRRGPDGSGGGHPSSSSSISSHPTTITIPSNPQPDDNSGGLDGMHLADPADIDRLRAAAATELTPEEVQPIQTDFHFFVKERRSEFQKLAEDEVLASIRTKKSDPDFPLALVDPVLINTNLNTRLMRAWEHLTPEQREVYMTKEEQDRRRFMEEDEIASRHCATLTARGKSPRTTYTENGNGKSSSVEPTPSQQQKQIQQIASNVAGSNGQPLSSLDAAPIAGSTTATSFHAPMDSEGGYCDEKKEEDPSSMFEEKKDDAGDFVPVAKMSTPVSASENTSNNNANGNDIDRSSKRIKTEEPV